MARAKLILICQWGGEFVMKDDGSMSYNGGDAQAVDISLETLIDDLKLKLAEMCNFNYKSLSMKYFLPGNRRTLINLSSDKDLKRMYEFYGNAVTAEVFVMGEPGFVAEEGLSILGRTCGIKLAESVTPATASTTPAVVFHADANPSVAVDSPIATFDVHAPIVPAANPTPGVSTSLQVSRRASSVLPAVKGTQSPSTVLHTLNMSPDQADATGSIAANASVHSVMDMDSTPSDATSSRPTGSISVAADASLHRLEKIDMNSTPADTVKKRRRTTAWIIGANGPTIVSVSDDGVNERNTTSRKKNTHNYIPARDTDNEDQELCILPSENGNSIGSSQDAPGSSKNIRSEELVTLWKDGITGVGQAFTSVHEFRDVLQNYAIAHRFMYRFSKNDTNRATCKCIAEGCSWRINASWDSSMEKFMIKKMEKMHTCERDSGKVYHPKKNWLVNTIKDRLADNPHLKPKEIVKGILLDFGITVNYTQVRRGIEDAKEQIMGSYKEAYNLLPWFCEKTAEANPGSNMRLFTGDDGKFQRLFNCFHASIHGFKNGCRPLLFLDSVALKSKYHECFLTATALDGDDGLFPVAYAIVDTENDDSWHWFLEQLRSAISVSQPITFVFDRETELKKSVTEVFENAHHGYSMYHLLRSFRRGLKPPFHGDGKGSLTSCFVSAAQSFRSDGFKYFTHQIKQISSPAYDWVMESEPECWANSLFKGEHYNHITVNVAETYTNWIEEMRALPIIRKIEGLNSKLMNLINTRRTDSSTWSTQLTPSKEIILRERTVQAQQLKVLCSTDTLFEVRLDSSNVVDLKKSECSCLEWKATGLPCCHIIAVFKSIKMDVYAYCSRYYEATNFRSTYSESINPVTVPSQPLENVGTDAQAVIVLPPSVSRPQSDHQENRTKAPRAKGVTDKQVFCSKCKEPGHNKTTCKA